MVLAKTYRTELPIRDMKKALLAIAFVFATATAFAQSGKAQSAAPGIEQRAAAITQGMARHLRLTPQQTQKIADINLSSMKAAEKAKVKYKKEPRRIVEEMDMISQTRLTQIKEVLTPLQFSQYQQRREEKMGVPREAQSNPGSSQGAGYNEQYNN